MLLIVEVFGFLYVKFHFMATCKWHTGMKLWEKEGCMWGRWKTVIYSRMLRESFLSCNLTSEACDFQSYAKKNWISWIKFAKMLLLSATAAPGSVPSYASAQE